MSRSMPRNFPRNSGSNPAALSCWVLSTARGWKVSLPGEARVRDSVGRVAIGFRYTHGKNVMTKFDLVKVIVTGGGKTSDSRRQISVTANW